MSSEGGGREWLAVREGGGSSPAQSLLHQRTGHLATMAMLPSTQIVSGDDETSQGICHLLAW